MSLVEIYVVNSETKPVILSLNYVYATDIHLSSVQHDTVCLSEIQHHLQHS